MIRHPRRAPRAATAWNCSCTPTPRACGRTSTRSTTAAAYTQIMKTDALKQALTEGRYDCRHRRRPARRGTLARQGARVLGARPRPHLGPEAPAAGALAPLQRQPRARRNAARLPAVQLDRARRVDLHPGRSASTSCRCISPPSAPPSMRDGALIVVDDDRMRFEPGETAGRPAGAVPLARLLPAVRRGRRPPPRRWKRSSPRCAPRACRNAPGG